jgi:YD repeat-containing protein
VASATAPNGAAARYTHDTRGNLVKAVNALGHETQYAWDGANRLIGSTAPDGVVSGFT